MTLIFTDNFTHYESSELQQAWPNSEDFKPKYPGIYTVKALPNGSAEVTRQHDGKEEIAILHAGESQWGISWNGMTQSVTEDAWEKNVEQEVKP